MRTGSQVARKTRAPEEGALQDVVAF